MSLYTTACKIKGAGTVPLYFKNEMAASVNAGWSKVSTVRKHQVKYVSRI